MVQREIADRIAAQPGTKAYGIPSVLIQLACEVKLVRPISRNVFRPVPNVDSGLVAWTRRDPPATTATRADSLAWCRSEAGFGRLVVGTMDGSLHAFVPAG